MKNEGNLLKDKRLIKTVGMYLLQPSYPLINIREYNKVIIIQNAIINMEIKDNFNSFITALLVAFTDHNNNKNSNITVIFYGNNNNNNNK